MGKISCGGQGPDWAVAPRMYVCIRLYKCKYFTVYKIIVLCSLLKINHVVLVTTVTMLVNYDKLIQMTSFCSTKHHTTFLNVGVVKMLQHLNIKVLK